jgi:peptide/nickel transport system substrate-binding protein
MQLGRSHIFSVMSLLVIASLTLTACLGSQTGALEATATTEPTSTPSQRGIGDILYILNPQAPDLLNPHISVSLKDLEPSRIVYEPLATIDEKGNLLACLAAEIPSLENGGVSEDGKSVTWKLRQDVFWSDGEPFTAEDVLFTYQYITNPDVQAATSYLYTSIKDVEVIDPYTIRVNFLDVTPAWFVPFVGASGLILPKHIFEPYNGPNAREAEANNLPVGTGPYRVMPPGIKTQEVLLLGSQLIPTKKIVFEPNPYYRDPNKPYFRRIEWRGGGTSQDAAQRVFVEGDIDFAYETAQLDPQTLLSLQEGGKAKLITVFGSIVARILLNRTDPNTEVDGERSSLKAPHPFLSDKKVRQAIAYAIDRDAIVALYGPVGRAANNNLVVPPQYNSPNTFYTYNPEKAKQLLDESGWKDTNGDGVRDKDGKKMKIVFQTPTDLIYQQTQQVVKRSLETVGIEVEIKLTDSLVMFGAGAEYPDSAWRFNADMMYFEISMFGPNPADYMLYWTCERIPTKANNWDYGFLNFERWCSPEYDALAAQSLKETDPSKSQDLFIKMNDMLIEDVVMIPIVNKADAAGVSLTLTGVSLTPWDYYTWNISEWRRTTP